MRSVTLGSVLSESSMQMQMRADNSISAGSRRVIFLPLRVPLRVLPQASRAARPTAPALVEQCACCCSFFARMAAMDLPSAGVVTR